MQSCESGQIRFAHGSPEVIFEPTDQLEQTKRVDAEVVDQARSAARLDRVGQGRQERRREPCTPGELTSQCGRARTTMMMQAAMSAAESARKITASMPWRVQKLLLGM